MMILAQLAADNPVPGWTGPVVFQINAGKGGAPNLANIDGQVARIRQQFPGAALYIDREPGSDDPSTPAVEGWLNPQQQAWAIQLGQRYPGSMLFGGVAFDTLVQKAPDQARAVAAAFASVGFPCYHATSELDRHLSMCGARLSRLKAAGIAAVPFVWRLYHDSAGALARTPVPLPDFLAGVRLCAGYADPVLWAETAWNPGGPTEVALGLVAELAGVSAERDAARIELAAANQSITDAAGALTAARQESERLAASLSAANAMIQKVREAVA